MKHNLAGLIFVICLASFALLSSTLTNAQDFSTNTPAASATVTTTPDATLTTVFQNHATATAHAEATYAALANTVNNSHGTSITLEQQNLLQNLANTVDLSIIENNIIATIYITEEEVNILIDAFIHLAEFSPEQITIDLQPGGVLATLTNINASGSVVTFYMTGGLGGNHIDLTFAWATNNGASMSLSPFTPAEPLAEVIISSQIAAKLDAALNISPDIVYWPTYIRIVEDAIVISAAVDLQILATPTPTTTPVN